ncbi:flagellar basal body L-ring protein FlgH [Chitinimonas naiadis]
MFRLILTAAAGLLLSACATSVPRTIVSQPTSVRVPAPTTQLASNGSIYHMANARLLFEDRMARHVGDNITVQIQEQVSASSNSANKAARKTKNTGSVTAGTSGTLRGILGGMNMGLESENTHDGSGSTTANNSFNGQITAQVMDLLPNGNLVIGGEKQVNIRGEISYLRVSGIVNPSDIQAGNVVSSQKIAEARIEEMGSGTVAAADKAGWLQNLFYSFLPF